MGEHSLALADDTQYPRDLRKFRNTEMAYRDRDNEGLLRSSKYWRSMLVPGSKFERS